MTGRRGATGPRAAPGDLRHRRLRARSRGSRRRSEAADSREQEYSHEAASTVGSSAIGNGSPQTTAECNGCRVTRILDPINLVLIPNLVAVVIARRYHVIAARAALGDLRVGDPRPRDVDDLRGAVHSRERPCAKPAALPRLTIGLGGAFFYVIGWGAVARGRFRRQRRGA